MESNGPKFQRNPETEEVSYSLLELNRENREFRKDWSPRKMFEENLSQAWTAYSLSDCECY